MEDQGKRLLYAVMGAFAVMLVWQLLFPAKRQEEKPQSEEVTDTADPAAAGQTSKPGQTPAPGERPATPDSPSPSPTPSPTDAPPLPPPVQRGPEVQETLSFEEFHATFSSWGGTLVSWQLEGDKYHSGKGQFDLVPTGAQESARSFALRFDGSDILSPQAEWAVNKKGATEIEFTWSTPGGAAVAFDVIKNFKIFPEDYLIELTIDVVNKTASEAPQKVDLALDLFGYQDPDASTGGGWTRIDTQWKSACYMGGDVKTKSWKSLRKSSSERTGQVHWAGFSHSYFLIAAAPIMEDDEVRLGCNGFALPERGGMGTELVFPTVEMNRGDILSRKIVAYLGPKFLGKLESIDGRYDGRPDFAESIDLGWFEFIARPMLWLLQWFHSFVLNWGIAIIILTILVKLATLYWTTKSMRSMKAMAKLKPQIEALQKKYKDDKPRQQQEMMNLYKTHKVNPLAGCLPLLLQMPIWFALYRMIMKAAELYHEPFIAGWVDDLTSPDPILAVLLLVMMFVQAKLSPTTPDSTQQKIMMYGLPLMFGVLGFFFPSGLTLYILTNTTLTSLHHLWMNRTDPHRAADAAKAKAKASAAEPKKSRKKAKRTAPAEDEAQESDRDETAAADDRGDADDSADGGDDDSGDNDGDGDGDDDSGGSESSVRVKKPGSKSRGSRGGQKKRGKRKRR